MGMASASFGQVVINEVHFRPAASAMQPGEDPSRLQFVEIHNPGASAVDLSGWSIVAAKRFTFPRGTMISPDEYLVVARDPAFLRERGPRVPSGVQLFGWPRGDLSAGAVRLLDPSRPAGAAIDQAVYGDAAPWQERAAGLGSSLELVNPKLHNRSARAWRPSAARNGTPGARNSRFSDAPIVLEETPARGSSAAGLERIVVTFSEEVRNLTRWDLTVDGAPATSVAGSGAGPYVFEVDPPQSGKIEVALAGSPVANPEGAAFPGDSWAYFAAPTAVLSMPHDAAGGPGATVQVPISAAPADGILGIDMRIAYDYSVVQAQSVAASGIASGFALIANLNNPGVIIISMYATSVPLSGSGEIARITFHVVANPGAASNLTFTSASINEGTIPAALDNGLFTVNCSGAANGLSCNDGNGCTVSDQCLGGVCTGTAIQVPGEIANALVQADKTTFVWDPAAGAVPGTAYDVVRGSLGALPVGPGGGDEMCLANDISLATASDLAVPGPGAGFWYLVRAENSCGLGTYGFEFRAGAPSGARVTTTCP